MRSEIPIGEERRWRPLKPTLATGGRLECPGLPLGSATAQEAAPLLLPNNRAHQWRMKNLGGEEKEGRGASHHAQGFQDQRRREARGRSSEEMAMERSDTCCAPSSYPHATLHYTA